MKRNNMFLKWRNPFKGALLILGSCLIFFNIFNIVNASENASVRLGDTLFDAGMEKFGTNVNNDPGLDDTSDVTQKYADICVDSQGILYSVYQRFSASTGTGWDIYFNKNTAGLDKSSAWKENFHPIVRVDDTGNGIRSQEFPKIDVAGSGASSDVIVVWQDERAGDGTYNIYAARSSDGGLSFFSGSLPNMRVDDTGINSYYQTHPDVSFGPDKTAYVVWADSREGYYRIYSSKLDITNNTFSPNVKVSNYNLPSEPNKATLGQDLHPSIAVDSAGIIYVAWEYQIQANMNSILDWSSPTRNDAQAQIWFSKSSDKGQTWSDPVQVSLGGIPSHNHNPKIGVEKKSTAHATDYIHFTWDGRDGGTQRSIFYARSLADGSGMTNLKVSSFTDTAPNKTMPDMDIDSFGNVNIVWQDDRYSIGTGTNIMYTKSPDRGLHFYSPIKADNAVQASTLYSLTNPAVSSWNEGDIFISWHDNAKSTGRDNSALGANTRLGGATSVWSAGTNISIPKIGWISIYDTGDMEVKTSKFVYAGNAATGKDVLGNIDLDSAVKICFSKIIDEKSINSSNFKLLDENSIQIAGTYTINEQDIVLDKNGALLETDPTDIDMITAKESLSKGSVVTFIPSGSLNYSQEYTLVIYGREPARPQGVADKLGYGFTYNNYYTPSNVYTFVAKLDSKRGTEYRISELYNSPNPSYDGTTVINYNLHFEPSEVTLRLYNTDGVCVNHLDVSANYGNNRVNFNCVDDTGEILANGVYFYLIRAVCQDTGEVIEMWEKLALAR
ncbi:MAG: hypothetical protein JXR41_15480 [Bacteroidales bacterium]|nr:hypothetical protein [Bacteroidales bacterium]